MAVQGFVDGERLAEFRRPVGQFDPGAPAAQCAHMLDSFDRLARPDQYPAPEAVRASGHIHAIVHAVGEIHVRMAGRTEHRSIAFTAAVIRVARWVVLIVSFRFHDAYRATGAVRPVANQQAAEQPRRRLIGAMDEQIHGNAVLCAAPAAVLVVVLCHVFPPVRRGRVDCHHRRPGYGRKLTCS